MSALYLRGTVVASGKLYVGAVLREEERKRETCLTAWADSFQCGQIKYAKSFSVYEDVAIKFQLFDTSDQRSLGNTQHIRQFETG